MTYGLGATTYLSGHRSPESSMLFVRDRTISTTAGIRDEGGEAEECQLSTIATKS